MIFIKKILNRLVIRPWLRANLNSVGNNFRFGYSSNMECPKSFSVGDDFFSGPYTYFSSNKDTMISIGSKVMFGPYCKVIGGNHNISWVDGQMMDAPYLGSGKGVIIEDDVWIGAGTTILDGAFIAEGTVLAAGTVITGKTIPYSIYGGVPARFIKFRFSKEEIVNVNSSLYNIDSLLSYYE